MQLLGVGVAEVGCELSGGLGVLGVRVVSDSLGSCEGLHLLLLAVHGEGRQLSSGVVVAQGFLHVGCGPGAGEQHVGGAILNGGKAGSAVVVGEVRIGDHIDQIRSNIGAVLREDHACIGVIALLAKQAQTIIEAVDVPGILQGEGDLGLGKDGIEVLGLILGDLGLVVVHEPRVVGVRHTVELAIGTGDGIDFEVAVLFLHLLLGVGTQLANGLGVHQNAQLIGSEHIDIGRGGRIGADLLGSVTFGDDVVLPSDVVLWVILSEVLFDLAQPIGILGLVFLRSPHAQGDVLSAGGTALAIAVGGAAACSERDQHCNSCGKSDCLLPIDLH